MIFGPSDQKYTESVREFALTLHFYSPKAYSYIRVKFGKKLPAESTIRTWYRLSESNGKPGLCEDSLAVLKNMAVNMKKEGKQLICSLNFDEMAIRKHIQWSHPEKKFLGNITYGFRPNDGTFLAAGFAIVFMVIGVNVDFKVPVAFHFIGSLKSDEKAALLQEILARIIELDIKVISVIFDGLSTNITMCKQMGANFEWNDFRPYFFFSKNNDKIYIILDASHMIKLVRNTLARNKILYDGNNSKIEWKYFEWLEKFRSEKGYTMVHKLTKRHIQWYRAPMNVRLATETISNSVANAMEFLMRQRKKQFVNCPATVQFIRNFNNAFDILNTKDISNSNVYKNAMNPSKQSQIFSFFDEMIEYIKSLRIASKGKLLIKTVRKTAFRGLIIDMINLKNIYVELLDSQLMESLPTFKFSQDPLECLFGRIRSRNGCNDNPTAQQFCAAFRKVVVNTQINCSSFSNCIDCLNILTISSKNSYRTETNAVFGVKEYLQYIESSVPVQTRVKCDFEFDILNSCSVAYVAGSIEHKIESVGRFNCESCRKVFTCNEKIVVPTVNLAAKQNVPCKSTFEICTIAKSHLTATMHDLNFDYNSLLNDILRDINYNDMYSKTDFEGHVAHKFHFIFVIVEEFLRVEANYFAKESTLNEHAKMLRNKLKKLVINYHQ